MADEDDVMGPVEEGLLEREHAMPHDSMVTVRLTGPPQLTVDTKAAEHQHTKGIALAEPLKMPGIRLGGVDHELEVGEESPRITMVDPNGNLVASPSGSESSKDRKSRPGSDASESAGEEVNWEELERTEENEPRDESSDDSTALLLARLEQENNLIAANTKPGMIKVQDAGTRKRSKSRPASIQQLKKLVSDPTPASLRYSMISAPPMTDLEFYAALVQDYTRTAQCLPTLLSKKIRSGIPPPLRGVVWQSMSGARDGVLEDQFDRLCGESSPYEGIIGKDLGRSFPGVEMFRDPEGDGQRMLGRVLKCFSLYDNKIGYCQGLGFLVGPLLMHMGDKQAFCVLVRLMEHYDLRSCFLPDLAGLHVRIHQFRELLKQHHPALSAHLDALQIEPAYVSQWFLSFFAVTCPLPMLFRIYDVIFAEGASETIMRVALSLMRKNEERILACAELEDVMQLLLSRGLWDCYHYNADEFVHDFVSLTGVVTHENLQTLETSYKESLSSDTAVPENIGSAASRFLGRLWAGSNPSIKPSMLSPGLTAPSRPVSFLRRSNSKQSIASTMNSMEGGGSESIMSSSTDATTISRDSSNLDGSSLRIQSMNVAKSNNHKNLHNQIEDLLTALSELQRDHTVLATQLQREREEREEDRHAVKNLLDGLKKKAGSETMVTAENDASEETMKAIERAPASPLLDDANKGEHGAQAFATKDVSNNVQPSSSVLQDELSAMLDVVESRFSATVDNRRSSMLQSKSQLRDELARSKEQLQNETSKAQLFERQISDHQQEIHHLKDQIKESHLHIRNAHSEKQRLERQIHELRVRKSNASTPDGSRDTENEWLPRSGSGSGHGLREFKLSRTNTSFSAPAFSKRTSSLNTTTTSSKESETPSQTKAEADNDALILELIAAKTAEAMAKQEAEETRAKLESLRKMLGLPSGDTPGQNPNRTSPQSMMERSATVLNFGGYLGKKADGTQAPASAGPLPTAAGSGSGWGGWGGWGKRTVSSAGGGAE